MRDSNGNKQLSLWIPQK